jgi:KAP family P-loop domain
VLIPDHETEVDFLNCEAVSRTVVDLLHGNRAQALTVGIHGDWGAGKSSILKMVERDLAKDKSVACLWFNGWAFQGFAEGIMASGHANRANRPNTWLHRPSPRREDSPCQPGAVHTWH